jgi:hypothetical protein
MRKKEFDTVLQIRLNKNLLESFRRCSLLRGANVSELVRSFMSAMVHGTQACKK